MKFIHTADWQIGKPFAGIAEPYKRSLVQKARIDAIARTANIAREESVRFILIAGDLFDSPSADKSTVAEACSAIGQVGVPVYVIPGNHDHGGPGSLWEQEFFKRESGNLAPNLTVLLDTEPLELDEVVLFPCPLLRRLESSDRTEWLRDPGVLQSISSSKPRIVLAHGSTQDFSGAEDDDELGSMAPNRVDITRLPMEEIDYIALGDWHGAKQIGPKAWYSGTPENDRFQKGEEQKPGHILMVEPRRGELPQVEMVPTGKLKWSEISFDLADDSGVDRFASRIAEELGQRTNEDLLRLSLSGSLGIQASNRLEELIDSLRARLLRLKVDNRTAIAPTDEEVEALTRQTSDPLIAIVAQRLVEMASATGNGEAETAAIALRELHAAYQQEGRS
ncbi:MAG: DNA repair exonuclease [Candidatus Obscuribacterales bacterium]|nr:DNA repair exonuclease [Candidatus Obscuribacterales bacterium]